VGALVEANHANPFELLGPHEIEVNGQRGGFGAGLAPHGGAGVAGAWTRSRRDRIGTGFAADAKNPPGGIVRGGAAQQRVSSCLSVASCRRTRTSDHDHDPYAFEPYLTDFDRYLIGEGRHYNAYDKLGAQLRTVDGIAGVNLRRLGAERPERGVDRRLQRLGRPQESDAEADSQRHLGMFVPV